MNIAEILSAQARIRPDAPAIIDVRRGRTRTLTFAALEGDAMRGVALLQNCGLRPGDAVLVFVPMSAELYTVLLAAFRLGLTAMFLDPSAGRAHIERCCALQPPRALIASPKAHALRLLSPALRRVPIHISTGGALPGTTPWSRARRFPVCEHMTPCAPDTPALLTFTSGSTGRPKAAVRTHSFLRAQHHVLEKSIALCAGETDLATLPIFVLANLASGVCSLLPDADMRRPATIDPAPVIAQIRAHQPTRAGATPAFWERMLEGCQAHGEQADSEQADSEQTHGETSASPALPSLRKIYIGGAPVFPGLLRRLQVVAPHAEIVAVYGSTEAEPIAHITANEALNEALTDEPAVVQDGRGLPAGDVVTGIQLRILPDGWGRPIGPYTTAEFDTACLPPDEAGEIVVSGAHVLRGYLHGQGDKETKFTVGDAIWHRTGDAGYLDAMGKLWLLGRCAARIEDERGTLYPLAVECAAQEHLAVRRAAFIAHGGQRILVVEPNSRRALDERAPLQQSLAWARVEEIRVVQRIPMDARHNAKVDYAALHRLIVRPKKKW